jgi:hypothetical protein
MALLSGELPGAEQAELDCAGDFGDARLTWLAGGEVAGELLDETQSGSTGWAAGSAGQRRSPWAPLP